MLQIADEKQRDKWVEELLAGNGNGNSDVDTGTASAHGDPAEIPSQPQSLDIPSISYTSDHHGRPPVPGSSVVQRIQPWLEPVKSEDGSMFYLSHQRTKSTDSDFPRSRTASLYSTSTSDSDHGVTSESGYLSGDVGPSRSRSVSYENMSDCSHSQSTSPDDPTKSFLFPVCQLSS